MTILQLLSHSVGLLSENAFYIRMKLRALNAYEESLVVKLWKWEQENLPSVLHSLRTAIAATVSLAVARLVGLPEAYWAAIATLVVMQSTLSATLLISIERIAARRWVLWPVRSWQAISRGVFWRSRPRYLCWDSCALDFAWREPRIGMRASRSPLSCLFRVHTLHGSLHFTASSKSRLESWSHWRSWPSGRASTRIRKTKR